MRLNTIEATRVIVTYRVVMRASISMTIGIMHDESLKYLYNNYDDYNLQTVWRKFLSWTETFTTKSGPGPKLLANGLVHVGLKISAKNSLEDQ